jgi:hypothetical protein
MPITSKLKRHKIMERTMRALMGNNLPPRFKFKDTYDSIEVPAVYQQYLPTQAEIEAKFEELEVQEEAVENAAIDATVISKTDSVIISNLEVGTANLFVDTETSTVGIGTVSPAGKLHLYYSGSATDMIDKRTNISTTDYGQTLNYTHYSSVAQGVSRNPDNSRGLWIGNMVDENDGSPSGTNFAAFTDSFQFYAVADRTKYDDGLSFVSNSDTLKYSDGNFVKVMHINANGNVGIGTMNPGAKLHVNGGITKTQYNPGEVIETLQGRANGRSITVLSGTYTPTNVTALQEATTSHAVINGSSISYKPPAGTTRVIYEFWCFFRQLDAFPIMHYAGRVAGTQVSDSRHTWRETTAGGSDYQTWVYSNMTLTIGEVASDNLAAGQLASWTTNKTIDFTFREYNATYEGRLHMTNHWDGGGTDIVVKPVIKITAIA